MSPHLAGSHSHAHAHRHGQVPLERGAVTALHVFLAVCAIAAVIGVLTLWPDSGKVHDLQSKAQFAAPGVTFPTGTVTAVGKDHITVRVPGVSTPAQVGVPPAVSGSGLSAGDKVRLMRTPGGNGATPAYSYVDVVRTMPLWILWAVFVVVVAAVARLRGILALVALGFGGLMLVKFMLPALLSGSSGLGVALAGSASIMFVVLYLAHGFSVRTSAALAGTLLGIGITALIGQLAIHGATLSGFADEDSALLSAFADSISFQGLLTCALVVAGLGVLNDVTITQASAVWELREAGPELSRRSLFTSAMRIGRDHIASTIYTIVFAYAGSALAVLLLLTLYDRPLGQLLSSENISEEIVRTLASGIGLVLAVPVTTAIAAFTVTGARRVRESGSRSGSRSVA